jgi:hypothetical protein
MVIKTHIMPTIYGIIYFNSYVHKYHLLCGLILVSHFQNLTVPGATNFTNLCL